MENNKEKDSASKEELQMALTKKNYVLMLIGFGIMILGFVLMIGGASEDPIHEFNYEMFNFQRITLAPMVVITGVLFEVYAIMKRY